MREVTITVVGMHCASCGLLVDDCMLDVAGVSSSRTDTKSGLCVVQAQEAVDDATLLAAVVEAGYSGTIAG